MNPAAPSPTPKKRLLDGWRTRRRTLVLLWLAQAPLMYLAPLVFIDPGSSIDSALRMLTESDYFIWIGSVILTILGMQAAILSAVRRPQALPGPARPSWPRLIAAGAGVGGVVALLVGVSVPLLHDLGLQQVDSGSTFHVLFSMLAGLTAATITTGVLRVHCREGMSVRLSISVAAFAGAALGVACIATLIDVVELISGSELPDLGWLIVMAVVPATAWAIMTPLLLRFARRRPGESALSTIANRLFIGTLIEAVAVLPIHVMVRRKSSCYCAEGSFWSLIVLVGVGFLSFGPAIFLLPIGRRRQRLVEGRCPVCAYDLSGTPRIDRCPECGTGWRTDDQ